MKKVLASVIIAVSLFIGVHGAKACGGELTETMHINPADIKIQAATVSGVVYNEGWYYLQTAEDELGGKWILELIQDDYREKDMNTYNKYLIGKTVDVQYINDFELLSWYYTLN
jgi:hypothetical protein